MKNLFHERLRRPGGLGATGSNRDGQVAIFSVGYSKHMRLDRQNTDIETLNEQLDSLLEQFWQLGFATRLIDGKLQLQLFTGDKFPTHRLVEKGYKLKGGDRAGRQRQAACPLKKQNADDHHQTRP